MLFVSSFTSFPTYTEDHTKFSLHAIADNTGAMAIAQQKDSRFMAEKTPPISIETSAIVWTRAGVRRAAI
ncbi:predicted protein [Sclerotinia sclerotiorum 1980 UF-70]|uniref:Uncharacterized protein n=1 Tax=Sclerotinia sclerotiorum (strain ATCC 18683 / 1980 / Ss-1) TaxID=665079 RepID=A7E693_SCLS1|nr:predicted protein [Sclerotinia sclerotiorum 1980 UF-70]EDN91415.1 predicted protein [Sclerotinia sclerotiorum 1980 UF-70]